MTRIKGTGGFQYTRQYCDGELTMSYFTAQHEELRKSVRRFVETELAPHAQEWEEAAYFADWVFPRMGELGFLGLHYPTEYGGQGGDYFASVVLSEEMARCRCGGLGMAVAGQTEKATPPIPKFRNQEQNTRYPVPPITGANGVVPVLHRSHPR